MFSRSWRHRVAGMTAALALLPAGIAVSAGGTAAHAPEGVVREPVTFQVTNPLTPGRTYTIHGELVRPRAGCSGSVLLAMHGLSYGQWAWDFPVGNGAYSVAAALANRGYALVTIDELGYGASGGAGSPARPNGYTITVEGYAEMAAQMVRELRAGTYGAADRPAFAHVGLIGHSAGSEIIELAAGLHPGLADVVIATAYTHEPFVDNNWLVREWTLDNLRAATSDYEYFETNPTIRAHDMYNLANADPAVVAWDTAHANLTPSGEVLSLGVQPSRLVLPLIQVPVLLVLADGDALFPASGAAGEMLLFTATKDKTLIVAHNDGHAFMLQRNGAVALTKIADWLDRHSAAMPHC
jgi:pimeloyl-ACP methyl ester carboxylesterase